MHLRSPHTKTLATALVVVLTGCDVEVRPGSQAERPDFVIASAPGLAGSGGQRPATVSRQDESATGEPWNVRRSGGTADVDARVCVIDSGVDLDHPDLNVSKEHSRSFLKKGPERGDPDDFNGHGTHVAGIIAALDNEVGTTGLASGATIVALKVVDARGRGYTVDVLEAINWAAQTDKSGAPRCDIVNFSIGAARSPIVDKAVLKASRSVRFVVSAGNKGRHVSGFSPAALDAKGVTVVTAMAEGDRWPLFANYGQDVVDYAAPGVFVHSTWKNGGYKTISGTSAAAAHVTALVLRGGMISDGFVDDIRGGRYPIPRAGAPEFPPTLASVSGEPERD